MLSDILLRVITTHPILQAKGSRLTHAELDQNFIEIFDALVGAIEPYDNATTYVGGITYYVSYLGNTWQFISNTDQTGVSPVEGAVWTLVSTGLSSNPVSVTVAQATTLANSFSLKIGTLYAISDAYDGTQRVFVRAINTRQFEPHGWVLYKNPTMAVRMWMRCGYDLLATSSVSHSRNADYIWYLYEAFNDNEVYQTDGTDTISKMPFDNYGTGAYRYFKGNRLRDVDGTWGATKTGMVFCKAENCTINTTLLSGSGDCILDNADIRYGAVIDLEINTGQFTFWGNGPWSIGAYLTGYVGIGASVTVNRAAIGSHIDDGLTLDTTSMTAGYSQTNGRLTAFDSTFGGVGSQFAGFNPDGSGIIDLGACSWVGVIGITDHSASGGTVLQLLGSNGRNYLMYCDASAGSPVTFDNSGGFLFLGAATRAIPNGNGSTLLLNSQGASAYERACTIIV